jgi:hypothetical protein
MLCAEGGASMTKGNSYPRFSRVGEVKWAVELDCTVVRTSDHQCVGTRPRAPDTSTHTGFPLLRLPLGNTTLYYCNLVLYWQLCPHVLGM